MIKKHRVLYRKKHVAEGILHFYIVFEFDRVESIERAIYFVFIVTLNQIFNRKIICGEAWPGETGIEKSQSLFFA